MKYERRHIEEIKKLAIELRKELSDQPLNIRAKISSIANLAEVCLTDASTQPDNSCPKCGTAMIKYRDREWECPACFSSG